MCLHYLYLYITLTDHYLYMYLYTTLTDHYLHRAVSAKIHCYCHLLSFSNEFGGTTGSARSAATGDRTGAAGTGGPLPKTPVRSGIGEHLSSSSRAGLELADQLSQPSSSGRPLRGLAVQAEAARLSHEDELAREERQVGDAEGGASCMSYRTFSR